MVESICTHTEGASFIPNANMPFSVVNNAGVFCGLNRIHEEPLAAYEKSMVSVNDIAHSIIII